MFMLQTGLLSHTHLYDVSQLKMLGYGGEMSYIEEFSWKLLNICRASVGLTGRALRKMPFLAHALYLSGESISLSQFLTALQLAVDKRKKEDLQQ